MTACRWLEITDAYCHLSKAIFKALISFFQELISLAGALISVIIALIWLAKGIYSEEMISLLFFILSWKFPYISLSIYTTLSKVVAFTANSALCEILWNVHHILTWITSTDCKYYLEKHESNPFEQTLRAVSYKLKYITVIWRVPKLTTKGHIPFN